MISIFILHTQEDAVCAATVRQGLEAQGYHIPATLSKPGTIDNGIRYCAAMIVLWSVNCVQSRVLKRLKEQLMFAQQLKKPTILVLLDSMPWVNTLTPVTTIIACQPPYTDSAVLLVPYLPSAKSNDPLCRLLEQLREDRKQGIQSAASLLKQGQYREPVLALLKDIFRNDPGLSAREQAKRVLRDDAPRFFVTCPHCKHISTFEKQDVCSPGSDPLFRGKNHQAGDLDELYLACQECKQPMVQRVDCEVYR